jgi:hypothetical protein
MVDELGALPKKIGKPILKAWSYKEDLMDLLALTGTHPSCTEVIGDLTLESGLEQPLGQRLEQADLAGEFDPALLGLTDQLVEQLPIQRVEPHRLPIDVLPDRGLFHIEGIDRAVGGHAPMVTWGCGPDLSVAARAFCLGTWLRDGGSAAISAASSIWAFQALAVASIARASA